MEPIGRATLGHVGGIECILIRQDVRLVRHVVRLVGDDGSAFAPELRDGLPSWQCFLS
jgi:hypothetical protein